MTKWNQNAEIEWAGLPVSIHRYESQPTAKVAPIILYLRGTAFQQNGVRDREVPIGQVFSMRGQSLSRRIMVPPPAICFRRQWNAPSRR